MATNVGFNVRNLLRSLLSFEIRQKKDRVALNLLRYGTLVVSLFLDPPLYPSWVSLPGLRFSSDLDNEERMTAW